MNLIVVVIVILVAWLLYSIIQSYNNLQNELKEIRLKCVSGGNNVSFDPNVTQDNPITNMKKTVLSGLKSLL